MSCDALRRGRLSLHHQVYCITTVTRGRHPLFTDITAARLLVRELRRLHEQGDVSSLARVVMPDHLHWLIQLNQRWTLSTVVKTLKARSALSINRHLCQHRSLWQRASLVRNTGYYPHWDCIWMTDDDETPLVE